ncbi:DUF4834 family protein [Flavobacterium sp. DG1-102-2]|nr:DUF4834 family protein [Flavobacterium sp. DG1-102-2]
METASLTGIIKTIFWLLVIYYAVKFFFKLFGPAIFQSAVKRAEQSIYQQYQNQQQQQSQQQYTAPKQDKPQEKKKIGEYIDFEEIE